MYFVTFRLDPGEYDEEFHEINDPTLPFGLRPHA
jgi:hypothetical protein